jgi:hypothetical protein
MTFYAATRVDVQRSDSAFERFAYTDVDRPHDYRSSDNLTDDLVCSKGKPGEEETTCLAADTPSSSGSG